ncbi:MULTISPECIES: (S)-benzoin forming benzil reductase [unclassified Paenibacillus]|uniref:(S)-benzoin forming benzil reductase n=1 Tax=unclassified Paenibacillus TaxID=185978 RepID=UPI001AE271AF|nr:MULTISPECIES: (S)-benzoin forming benzil reductase [unclassified Paenibacillus]MBP1155677.1 benzil reductase ((S)-benzoin forming) [Paenibacillus sp. PvP091]MBP1168937.1 benzil reductase ((S)-benzoin forming) [Paenibacillus sp. PvR098]MBP2439965.1 benzil reductase ((S)-benzoin forming) [Paenibacillus sp. PvP052]
MQLYIITGTSRGLGEALAKRVLTSGHSLVSISRSPNETLSVLAEEGAELRFYPSDLRETKHLMTLLERIITEMDAERFTAVTLVNNAGILDPIKPLDQAEEAELTEHLHVNLLAPMLLTSAFIRATSFWPDTISKTVANISSGAGKKPYSGWSAYCTAKAGIDMMTRCAGQEQGDGPGAVKLVSIAPGVVDTRMQEKIRETDPKLFPQLQRFIDLKASGHLYSADESAERILAVLESGDLGQGDVIDVRTHLLGSR